MMMLITGGSKNGKSQFAEQVFDKLPKKKIYIATMEPYGPDAMEAIARHQKIRAGKGFSTIEKYRKLEEIPLPDNCAVLIECMATLCANEMFSPLDGKLTEGADERILSAIDRIREKADPLVLVTNDVGCDGAEYPEETRAYIRTLGNLNRRLADKADTVIESVFGIPLVLKGTYPCRS